MKINASKELKSRLMNAALNGSIVAKGILEQLASAAEVSDIIKGSANFFSTKRKKTTGETFTKVKVVFTVCNKDVTNENFPDHNNPQAPWFSENRTEMDPATFVKCFRFLPEYSDQDVAYFANAICVDSRVTVKLYDKMSDFIDAYSGENYATVAQYGDSTLHNSCMRYENTTRNAADFYVNFAGAKILIATDAAHNVLGRAVVWEKPLTESTDNPLTVSVVDRVYYTHSFVMKMIHAYAESIGINLRKEYNDYSHPTDFIVMNPVEGLEVAKGSCTRLGLRVKVPASRWHKHGAAYMDTFQYVQVTQDGSVELCNHSTSRAVAQCQDTDAYATRTRRFCPNCGKLHNGCEELCDECYNKFTEDTLLGRMMVGKTVKYKNRMYPATLFKAGRPVPNLTLYLQLEKLYEA